MASATEQARGGGRGRIAAYAVILALCLVVIAAAYYQEELGYFFKLRTWDRGAPARVVMQFLDAGKQGDQKTADSLVGTRELKPLVEKGKWVGYFMPTNAGILDFYIEELSPATAPTEVPTEFVYAGNGAAMVKVPDRSGKPIDYRLELQGSAWKIMEIRAGRRRS
jgi:hypothetical protein